MNNIQLLYVKNVISRKSRKVQQHLYFFMWVENIGYEKQVDVVWRGEDGHWQTLKASYHSKLEPGKEYWFAQTQCQLTSKLSLPGNIEFALRYRSSGAEYWDNNQALNYSSQADSGIALAADLQLMNIGFNTHLREDQKYLPISIAVNRSFQAEKVTLHWTTDNWRHSHTSACHFNRKYWDDICQSNARNPNQYGAELWKTRLNVSSVFRLQYSISCESQGRILWDNNHGNNYSAERQPLKIMILNLHCYQEDNQDYKFSQIARAINELDIDIVCLQEVAELWNDGLGDPETNSAKIINDRLDQPYYLITDWSHLGFNKYREGVAI